MNHLSAPLPSFSSHDIFRFICKWTPRTVVAGLAGYYSLGIAYEKGIMAAIDRLAIHILGHTLGYAGIGALMPSFQWYSAWTVRLLSALAAGFLYDLIEKVVHAISRTLLVNWESIRQAG